METLDAFRTYVRYVVEIDRMIYTPYPSRGNRTCPSLCKDTKWRQSSGHICHFP